MLRLGIAMLVGAVFCFLTGAKGCNDTLKFQKPVTISAQDFMKKRPEEGWYHVTNATMLLTEAKYMVTKSKYSTSSDSDDVSKASTIYLPVHAGADVESKSLLVLKTEDPSIKQTMMEVGAMDKVTDQARVDAWIEKNKDRILIHRDITGMVAAGIDDSSSDKAEIAKLGEELGPNFSVLNEGQKPTGLGPSLGLMVGGVVLVVLGLVTIAAKFVRSR